MLSFRLKETTREAHRRVEGAPFVQAMLRGKVAPDAYAAYLERLHTIYATLEGAPALRAWLPEVPWDVVGRERPLRRDLAAFGRCPEPPPSGGPVEGYQRYLTQLVRSRPWGLLGHAYCRYLGDLSGGRIVGRLLAERHGFSPERLTFYRFNADPGELASAFRVALDAAPLDEPRAARVVEEAVTAFDWNERILRELSP